MDWFALDTKCQLSFERKRIPFEVRGFHLAVLALLAEREQGPALIGARAWTNRDWQLACGGTRGLADKLVAFGLAQWAPNPGRMAADRRPDGGGPAAGADAAENLHVADYDVEGEERVREARISGAKGGKSRGSKLSDPSREPSSDPASDPARNPSTRDETGTRRDETRQKKPRAAHEVSADALDVAAYLLDAIRSHAPLAEDGSAGWAKDIDAAIRLGGFTADRLRAVIDFAHRSRETFWRSNLLSGKALKKHAGRLEVQMASPTRGGGNASKFTSGDELRAMAAEMRLRGVP